MNSSTASGPPPFNKGGKGCRRYTEPGDPHASLGKTRLWCGACGRGRPLPYEQRMNLNQTCRTETVG